MPESIPLVFASMNPGKRAEIAALLPGPFRLATPEEFAWTGELPETGRTLEDNALQKARFLYERSGLGSFADDSGLEVDALGGAPGVDSAHYAGPQRNASDNIRLLLGQLKGNSTRTARFKTVIAWVDASGSARTFEGVVEGRILEVPRGHHGFGYDPVFVPADSERSFAEMSSEEKNAMSHRARAFKAFWAFLHP
ncbi:RdgB/HAM1 family non-canonical purine NTP pyrophosphatase [bacterium]|nr:RdgB/HAM1 family non-canonical purine NTP pyrophosphatase [bacterium]